MLALSNVFEPIRPAIFELEEWFPTIELPGLTFPAFRGIWAVQEWDMVIANISEPKQ